MQKRAESAAKIRQIKREKQFRLDCTNLGASKYRQYNPLRDKYLQYIVPCPCNFSLHKSKKKKVMTSLIQQENDNSRFQLQSRKSSTMNRGKIVRHFLGRIIKNVQNT